MGESVRALWVADMAFEDQKSPPETLVHSAVMQATCMWFLYAADRLWTTTEILDFCHPPRYRSPIQPAPRIDPCDIEKVVT